MFFKIAFFTMIKEKVIGDIVDGLSHKLRAGLGNNFRLIKPDGIINRNSLKKSVRHYVVEEEVDLVFCVGDSTTQTVYEVTNSRRKRTPFIAMGISSLESLGIPEYSHGIAVGIEQSNESLPAQAILKLFPEIRSILIPYRPDSQNGRKRYDAELVKKYFEKRRINVELFEIISESINESKLRQALERNELAINIEGGLLINEIESVAEVANSAGIPFWADGAKAAEHGIICAVKNDFHVVASIAGEIGCEILTSQVDPRNMQSKVIPSSRSLEVNSDLAFKKGLVLNEEIKIGLDRLAGLNRNSPTTSALFVMRRPSCFNHALMGEWGLRMKADTDENYYYQKMTAWLDDSEQGIEASFDFLGQAMECNEIVIAFEDAIAFQIYKYFKDNKITRPIIVLTHEQEAHKQHWYRKAHELGIEVIRFFIPMPSLVAQFNALHTVCPKVKELNVLVYQKKGTHLTQSLQQRLEELQNTTAAKGITCNQVIVDSKKEFDALCKQVPKNSTWLLVEDSFRPEWLNDWAQASRNAKAVCVSGTLGAARRFPINVGYDYRKLSQTLHPYLKDLSERDTPPRYRRINLRPQDFCATILNGGLCLELGLSPAHAFMLTQSILPLDHAIDTARCLHLITLAEHQELEKEIKERRRLRQQEPTHGIE